MSHLRYWFWLALFELLETAIRLDHWYWERGATCTPDPRWGTMVWHVHRNHGRAWWSHHDAGAPPYLGERVWIGRRP